MYKIYESNEYEKLTYLFHENGLEVEPGVKKPDNVLKCWECKDSTSNKLIGGADLEKRNGEFVVSDVAVDINYRKENIGTQLMNVVEAEIIKMGGKEAWLVAKVPAFYLKLGWEVVEREKAPDISNCFSCPKYGKECNPRIMHKALAVATNSLNTCIQEYKIQLDKGYIQKAYKGIMAFMSDLRAYLDRNSPDYSTGAIYSGYMDMTYFAFTPPALKEKQLKIAIVFLHEDCRFEVWLAGSNRKIQADYIELFKAKDLGKYTLTQIKPGVDSIIESVIVERPDFNDFNELRKQIETATMGFIKDIISIL